MNTPKLKDLRNYTGNYSGSKFWEKIPSVAKGLGRDATHYALLLYYTLQSPDVSLENKTIIIGALGYLILPIDLIPDLIPVLGLADDAGAIKLAYDTVKASITPDVERKASAKLRQWFGDSANV